MKLHNRWLALPILAALALALGGFVAPDLAQAAAPFCGDDKQTKKEECDGRDDAACPDQCQADCTCLAAPSVVEEALCEHLGGLGIHPGKLISVCELLGVVPPTKTIFVTSGAFSPNLAGLAGADNLCQEFAVAGGLPGTPGTLYRAWLSDSTVDARDRLTQNPGPYRLPTGQVVAVSWADLVDGHLLHAINVTETGGTQALTGAWTATLANGVGGSNFVGTCGDWTDTSLSGGTGLNVGFIGSTNSNWTFGAQSPTCSFSRPLYCLEQ